MNAKGNITSCDPIYSLADIAEIKDMLKDHPRNFALFVVGINTAFRASDLAGLKVKDVIGLSPGSTFTVRMKKTKECIKVAVNVAVYYAILPLIVDRGRDEWLFANKFGGQLTTETIGRMVKEWCRKVGCKGRFSSHTLRKTFGYHALATFGHPIEHISEAYGHGDVRITRKYLCIQAESVKQVFMDEL